MPRHVLFLTGTLAEPRLRRLLDSMAPLDFGVSVADLGVKVAALMTVELVMRRLEDVGEADLVVLPGRFRGDLGRLEQHYGVRFERGPEELVDLPEHFGRAAKAAVLARHDCRIFAEIVDAPQLAVPEILTRAGELAADGADVIDLGCLPDCPFPHLEEAVQELVRAGFTVSVDSADTDELRRGSDAGASYVLSLNERTLWLSNEIAAIPVVIPARGGDLSSLYRAVEIQLQVNRPLIADPILDPIHFGFTASLARYTRLRKRFPELDILMGIGNVTELTDADTPGINALLMGVISELRIGNVLAVQVSPHCRHAVREFNAARRLFFAAREQQSLPQGFSDALMCLRDRRPFRSTPAEIAEQAAQVRDRNFRIETSPEGVHVYSRDLHEVASDPYDLFPSLDVDGDVGHAFYLGVETARAEIAWTLGKRYVQDRPLKWGVAADAAEEPLDKFKEVGTTKKRKATRKG